jgi:ATP-dependent Clp protease ATP-binding subunit ClpA
MFLAGPTGAGKTELAKSLAELIFGSATNYIRFDMSEFNQEHANQRLMGAPPGYVGYDVGGELTNAVKQNPFSLILFDEIEKAHPKLMDIFLQILDDGRLTSGRGETVYFSDALIIFTSNLGVYQETEDGRRTLRINPDMDYQEVREEITAAISEFFNFRLNRPEILNRLGPNIVVFDFIRPREAGLIFGKMLNNVLAKLRDSRKITIILEEEDRRLLSELACRDLGMGGRGIGNALERAFVNPLARALFEVEAKAGESYACRLSQGPDGQLSLRLDKSAG